MPCITLRTGLERLALIIKMLGQSSTCHWPDTDVCLCARANLLWPLVSCGITNVDPMGATTLSSFVRLSGALLRNVDTEPVCNFDKCGDVFVECAHVWSFLNYILCVRTIPHTIHMNTLNHVFTKIAILHNGICIILTSHYTHARNLHTLHNLLLQ